MFIFACLCVRCSGGIVYFPPLIGDFRDDLGIGVENALIWGDFDSLKMGVKEGGHTNAPKDHFYNRNSALGEGRFAFVQTGDIWALL